MTNTIEQIPGSPEKPHSSKTNTDQPSPRPDFSTPSQMMQNMQILQKSSTDIGDENTDKMLAKILHDCLLIDNNPATLKISNIQFNMPTTNPKHDGILEFGQRIQQYSEYAELLDRYVNIYSSIADPADQQYVQNICQKYYYLDPAKPGFLTESNQNLLAQKIQELFKNNKHFPSIGQTTIQEIGENFKKIFTANNHQEITQPEIYGFKNSEETFRYFSQIKNHLRQNKISINARTIAQYFKIISINPNLKEDLERFAGDKEKNDYTHLSNALTVIEQKAAAVKAQKRQAEEARIAAEKAANSPMTVVKRWLKDIWK